MKTLWRVTLGVLTGITTPVLILDKMPTSPRMLGASVVRAEEESCSVASLHGTYAIHAQGTIVGQLPPPFPAPPFPFGEAGILKLNGAGRLSGKSTANLGGLVLQPTAMGSYTVNSDCTGTITIQSSAGFVLHDSIVVTDRGRRTVEVQTDPLR
jgi:hypothetical protein